MINIDGTTHIHAMVTGGILFPDGVEAPNGKIYQRMDYAGFLFREAGAKTFSYRYRWNYTNSDEFGDPDDYKAEMFYEKNGIRTEPKALEKCINLMVDCLKETAVMGGGKFRHSVTIIKSQDVNVIAKKLAMSGVTALQNAETGEISGPEQLMRQYTSN